MSVSRAIPCKRPKVTVTSEAVASGPLAHRATCEVPGCAWGYGPGVKTDVEQQASWHRMNHKATVPATKVVHHTEWDAHCSPCGGHRRTFATKRQAALWLDEHLVTEHGLVTCP